MSILRYFSVKVIGHCMLECFHFYFFPYSIIYKFIYLFYFFILLFQTDLTCQRIQEFETQASSDLEMRNNKIDELNRVRILGEIFIFGL
jgi:hypothetical protein